MTAKPMVQRLEVPMPYQGLASKEWYYSECHKSVPIRLPGVCPRQHL